VSCRGDPGQQGPGLVLVLGPRPGLGVGPDMGPWLLYSPPDTNRAPCNTGSQAFTAVTLRILFLGCDAV
jgi:hypothetical protein